MEDHEDLRQHCLGHLHLEEDLLLVDHGVDRLRLEGLVLVELLEDHLLLGGLWVVHLVERLEEDRRLCKKERRRETIIATVL